MADKEAHYTSAQVAAILEVQSSSTVRKYAGLLEDAGYIFDKDGQGRRIYSAADVAAFEKLIALSRDGGAALKDSARAVYFWSRNPNTAPGATGIEAPRRRDEEEISLADLGRLFTVMEEQQKAIQQMGEVIRRQAEDLSAVREALERLETAQEAAAALPEPEALQETPERQRGFFARLFRRKEVQK